MKNAFWFSLFMLIALAACKRDAKNSASASDVMPSANARDLTGHWIAIDFCFRAKDYNSVLGSMNNGGLPYAYAFTFDPAYPDSVTCYNGFEVWKLAVKYKNDTMELKEARPGKSIFLVYDSQHDKGITMFDATQGHAQMNSFVKSKAGAKDGYISFLVALNHNLFDGVFSAPGKGNEKIQFTPGGYITGWSAYDKYEVCTNGDCFVAGDQMDVITLSKAKVPGTEKMYAFQYNVQGTELSFYNLIPPADKSQKGGYTVKGAAYKLARKKAE